MHADYVDWEDDDDPKGNVQHMAHNEVTRAEFEEILATARRLDVEPSDAQPANVTTIGETSEGRAIRIVFELDEADPDFIYVRPITAYEPED